MDVVVVGAGIVGLAVAAALARCGRSVLILERREGIAREITSRNSEVIHAGIYYPSGSLKAHLCTRGRELIYQRCAARGVPCRKLGKLIVASQESEIGSLEELLARGEANGVPGLEMLTGRQVNRLEPQLAVAAGLLSPETGILDAQALALSFLAEAESHDAILLLHHEVIALERCSTGWRVETRTGSEASASREAVSCETVVNAAGLASDRLAELAGLDPDACGYRLHACKGDYFALAAGSEISLERLVYPVPAPAGLGIHATLDLAGRIRFGPDTEYLAEPNYHVRPEKAAHFAKAIRRYLPLLRSEWLSPDYAGIRPKLAGPGDGFRDFVVSEESGIGLPGLVDCIGIESPGLTAAPAIAEYVAELL